jgi:hypothetical protein
LLSAGTDGANTVGNIVSSGNITADYYFGDGSYLTGITSNYGNTEVSAYLASGADSAGIVTSGEITGANLLTGGQLQATGNVTGGNIFTSGYVTASGNIRSSANVSGVYILGNGSQLTGLPATYSNAQVSSYLASGTNTANIITAGNLSGAYILGNGSQLTGLPASYSNANVVTLLAAFGSNTISTTGNITGGNFIGSGAALTSLTGANVTGTVANATYATSAGSATTATSATTAITVTGNAQANITSVGTLTSLSVSGNIVGGNINTAGLASVTGAIIGGSTISATGNITGGNLTTAGQLVATGNITGGNVTGANIVATSNLVSPTITTTGSSGNITGVNYITASYFSGNGSLLTGVVASLPSTISVTGNITGGNINTGGVVSATGNITGGNLSGTNIDGTLTTAAQPNITSVGTLGSLAVTANISGGNINTGGVVSATGNITGGNITTTGTFTNGNLVVLGNNINTSNALTFTSSAVNNPSRILVGNAWGGNSAVALDFFNRERNTRLAVWDYVARGDGNIPGTEATFEQDIELTANIASNSTTRLTATQSILHIGGGSSSYQSLHPSAFAITGHQGGVWAGTLGSQSLGNTTIAGAAGFQAIIAANTGATISNAVSFLGQPQFTGTGAQLTNITAFAAGPVALATPTVLPTNYYAFYNPGLTATVGMSTPAAFRQATNYYAFRNDDDVAQVKLGSLRSYHEYQYSTATTGTVNIDKSNSQVQYLAPTGNVTIGSFQNFVTTATDAVTADNQSDTVTLIVKQSATPFTVTMPTGNAAIKYASGNSTVGTTANAVTMISITGSNIAGAAMYLVTVSPEFT